MALLVASRAAEFPKPWKSEGSAALALPSVIQHSPVQKLCKCPADFSARELVETICKSVLWLSGLPHALVSSPNLGKAKVRPPSPCLPQQRTLPHAASRMSGRTKSLYKREVGRYTCVGKLIPYGHCFRVDGTVNGSSI